MDSRVGVSGSHRHDFEDLMAPRREIVAVINATGQTPDADNLTQLQIAILNHCVLDNEYVFHENSRVLTFD